MVVSPLAPDCFPELPLIRGVRLTTARCGMKYQGRDDLMAMLLDPGSHVASSRNRIPPPPRRAAGIVAKQRPGHHHQCRQRQRVYRRTGMQDVIALCAGFAAHIGLKVDVLIAPN